MATQLTKEQFIEILLDDTITKSKDLSIFQAIYSFDNHKAYGSQVGRLLGHTGKMPGSPLNLQIVQLAKRIAKKHHINFSIGEDKKEKFWDIFFDGWQEGRFWIWQLKPNLISALQDTQLTGEIQYSDEIPTEYYEKLFEGAKRTITVNSYERNLQARLLCISYWGTKCIVCKIDFEKQYGEVGKGFIHVHHLIPISEIGKTYEIDPIKDLRPVCPNCHAMLHREKDALSIEELQQYYNEAVGSI